MRLWYEARKVSSSIVLWGLLVFFMIVNGLYIWSYVDRHSEGFSDMASIMETYGTTIDNEMMKAMELDQTTELAWMNSLVENPKHFDHPTDFIKAHVMELTSEETERVHQLQFLTLYLEIARSIDPIYENFSVAESMAGAVAQFGLTDSAQKLALQQSESIQKRVDELVANKEHKHLFYWGPIYKPHSFLFKEVGQLLIFELMILTVLITSRLINYEFEEKTAQVVYSTKTGRKLLRRKVGIAALFVSVFSMIVPVITWMMVFIGIDYSALVNVPISSYFNRSSSMMPYISWWPLSFSQYLLLFYACLVACQFIFFGLAALLAVFIRNTYYVFFVFSLIFGIGVVTPLLSSTSSALLFYTGYTPFWLVMNPHIWWMANGVFTASQYYELTTLFGWSLCLGVALWLSMRRFQRQHL
ncbi:hypothetical protein [Aureibacillus halotolerans]|uniref:ABC-2 family transporter n=1 Tax=Aureibacillus halotolerans TaxID=1508390 RepID=A0A4R6UDW0_9BACI|nr:hypothetical protein [Aureibacillus halotolerans]TDQ42995.1 hypothetical protein EV213_101427 [Aureibacillus halotolerans]